MSTNTGFFIFPHFGESEYRNGLEFFTLYYSTFASAEKNSRFKGHRINLHKAFMTLR